MNAPTLEQRLEARRDHMSPAALRVARYLVDRPDRAVVATAAEIAEAAQTSVATVVRTAQTLGYEGLPELRRGVGLELGARRDPRETLEQRVTRVREDPAMVLDTVLDDSIALLAETRTAVAHEAFESTVALLSTAERILVLGWGPTGMLAEYLALHLHRLGCAAVPDTRSGMGLADSLSGVRSGDVLVVIAPLAHVREIDVALDRAAEVNARVVLITELLGERLRHRVEHVLTTASSRRRTASHAVSTIVLIDALVLGVAAAAPERALDTWESIKAMWSALGHESSESGVGRDPNT